MALDFDGVSQYINITQTSGLPLYKNNTTYSICGWVKAAAQSDRRIFSEAESTSTYTFVGWGSGLTDTSKFRVRLRNDSNTTILDKESTTTVFDNTWHHFCWVDNNGTATLYIDGVADATNFNYTRSGSFNEDNSIIGATYYNNKWSGYLTGILFDIRCYNRCLTANEIAEIYHKRGADRVWEGMVGRWRLDELPSGTPAPLLLDAMDATTGWSTDSTGVVSLNSTTYIQGSGALNLTKNQTTKAEAYMFKTVSSVNVTGQNIKISAYIKDQTTLDKLTRIQLYLHSALAVNHYSYSFTNLSVGWNELSAHIDDFGESGTPDKTDIQRIRVDADTNNTTDTWAEGDIIFDFYRAGNYTPNSIIDLSGNGNHGTPYNSPAYQDSPHRLRRGVLVS